MNKMLNWLEKNFSPKMSKINNNVWVLTLKDSVMQVLPFIFLGSIFCMLTIPADVFGWFGFYKFWTPYAWTMGLVGLFVSFLIPFNLMEKKRLRKQRIIAGLSGLVTFLIIITPQVVADGTVGFGHSSMGAGGMFIAIVAGIFAGAIMSLFGKFSLFKEDSVIPDFVKAWFDSMIPIGIVVCLAWFFVDILGVDVYNIILAIFMPLQNVIETPWGLAFLLFFDCFIYSMGISSWVLAPIVTPIYLSAIQANVSGLALNIATKPAIYSAYLWMGGIGCTLPLVLMLVRSKSKKLKSLGIATLGPSILNINEPVVFGCIAWNPYLMIPMWLQGAVLPLVMWFFTKVIEFAPIPKIVFEMWYCPFPISTWLVTGGSIKGVLLAVIIFAVSSIIWYPFFKAYEKQEIAIEEQQEIKAE